MRRTAGVLLSATIPCLALSGCSSGDGSTCRCGRKELPAGICVRAQSRDAAPRRRSAPGDAAPERADWRPINLDVRLPPAAPGVSHGAVRDSTRAHSIGTPFPRACVPQQWAPTRGIPPIQPARRVGVSAGGCGSRIARIQLTGRGLYGSLDRSGGRKGAGCAALRAAAS
jgi:hypothetical protein